MTLLQPGEHWEGLSIVGNQRFRSRAGARERSLEEEFFAKAVYAAEMCQRQGWDVNPETMQMVNSDLPSKLLGQLLRTDKFQHALEQRGIPVSSRSGLSPRQIAALTVFMDMSTPATLTQKLRMAGVTKAEWDGWCRQPAFSARLAELSEDATKQNTPTALQRLAQAVDAGAPWAIQFSLAMNKRFDPRAEVTDPMLAVREIFDILDEILDEPTLRAIEERMRAKREGRPMQSEVVRIAVAAPLADTISASESEG